tara:strand:- start:3326 stop:3757 length:432 start_codon:yes stop_codon:yes gene_type:complete
MKKSVLVIFIFIFSCINKQNDMDLVNNPITANGTDKNIVAPLIMLPETSFDFGEIKQGESVAHDFMIRNIGKERLLIHSAKGSCGCTVSDFPKEPILPGEEAYVKVVFNTTGKKGKQKKTITLLTNAIPNVKVLTIIADIKIN